VTIHKVLDTWEPALTPRLSLVQESVEGYFGVILMHPGTNISTQPGLKPSDFSSMVVRIPDLIKASTENDDSSSILYIYDSTEHDKPPEFLGGATILKDIHHESKKKKSTSLSNTILVQHEPERPFSSVVGGNVDKKMIITEIDIATRRWSIVVIAAEGTFQTKPAFILLGGSIIVAACLLLAMWMYANGKRNIRLNQIQSQAEAEKANLILDNLTKSAKAERELNEYVLQRNLLNQSLTQIAL